MTTVSLPEDDFAERSRSIFERLRAAQDLVPEPEQASVGDVESDPEAEPAPDQSNEDGGAETDTENVSAEVVTGEEAVEPADSISGSAPEPDPGTPIDLTASPPADDTPAVSDDLEAHSSEDVGPEDVDVDTTLSVVAVEGPVSADPTPAPDTPPTRLDTSELDPLRFVRPLPRVLAIANQKGGVGKTTTTVNLGASLAVLGYRVLVIDLDPQGNATTGLGINSRNLDTSIYDVILHDTPLEDCVEPTSLRNLFVAPATIDLAGAEIELVPAFSREQRLKRALAEVRDDYEFVLIDCPPSLGLLTVNALSAASEVVVPIQCEYYALEGLGQLLRNINLVQANLNPTLELSAIVLTMYDARTKLAEQVADEVRQHFGEKVCRNVVPRTVRLSEAPSFGQPIIVFDPSSRGALAYRELAREVSGGAPQRTG